MTQGLQSGSIQTSFQPGRIIDAQELMRLISVSPLIDQGQSPYQILTNHPEIDMSVRTMYQYIMTAFCAETSTSSERQNSSEKVHKTQITDREVFIGRTFDCFQKLTGQMGRDGYGEIQRDSRKCLLTFYFTQERFPGISDESLYSRSVSCI